MKKKGNQKMQDIVKCRKLEKVGNQKKQKIIKSRKSEKVGNLKKYVIGKLWKSEKVVNQKKQDVGKSRKSKKEILKNQLIKGSTKIKIKNNQVMVWTFGLVYKTFTIAKLQIQPESGGHYIADLQISKSPNRPNKKS